jgi:hypothetical protein
MLRDGEDKMREETIIDSSSAESIERKSQGLAFVCTRKKGTPHVEFFLVLEKHVLCLMLLTCDSHQILNSVFQISIASLIFYF